MIHSIVADKETFKKIYFKEGFNVILAERTKEATKKDSRNGLGKSTLVEIINFCLGGNKGETLSKKQLSNWTFTMDIDLDGKRYSVSRNTDDENKILIDGDCSTWPIKPSVDDKTKKQMVSRNDWTRVLGTLMFNLQLNYKIKYHPTFRSLISYFIRKGGRSGGFLTPFQQYKSQLEWDIQVNNAYLLGLGWEYAAQWQILKDRQKIIDQIKQEAETGIISNLMGNIGELESLKIRLEDKANKEKTELKEFKVHQQYKQIQDDVNEITRSIHDIVNLNIDDRRLLEHYESSLKEEIDAKPEQVTRVYEEAGFIFSEKVSKAINEVLDFHKKIVSNRKEFLTSELKRIERDINKREDDTKQLTSKRAELMYVLQTHGALDEYLQLQTNHQNTIASLKDISNRLGNLKKFEEGKSALVLELEVLRKKANSDLEERQTQKQESILTFNSFSESLYKSPGILSINITKTGYKFGVEIQRSGSYGIGNMEIFCYDLTLEKMWSTKVKSPPSLIHDSIIFADVDERQKALALKLAESESRNNKFQYICTMNSDNVPRSDFDSDFNFDKYVVATFTDAKEDGGLLGIRF